MTIAVVDYGIGNLGSVMKAFRHLGAPAILSGDIAELRRADVLVLPGDGAFASTMAEIEGRGLVPVLREAVEQGRTLLGICIGMQLLFQESEEHGLHRGLGFLPGRVQRLEVDMPSAHGRTSSIKQPHPMLEGVADGSTWFRPFGLVRRARGDRAGRTDYGALPAIVGRGNVTGRAVPSKDRPSACG
jgi:glutamine amidotransferase